MIVQGSSYWLQLANRAELPKGLLLFFLTHFIRNQWKLNGFFGLSKLGWLKKIAICRDRGMSNLLLLFPLKFGICVAQIYHLHLENCLLHSLTLVYLQV